HPTTITKITHTTQEKLTITLKWLIVFQYIVIVDNLNLPRNTEKLMLMYKFPFSSPNVAD
ncbi:hypothetical protein, partial [Nitrosomonas europaea]|uniref:hypothetical protein n=1 Tax=Nitrosomonas europaea TaxID=915 RepID=UPI002BB3A9A6